MRVSPTLVLSTFGEAIDYGMKYAALTGAKRKKGLRTWPSPSLIARQKLMS